ncbi:PEPxxWA-CTERM sorting domain-containing protein [Parasphingorhabdus marina]|uniref:PEPxxWA-CTERM sorting domain-containing protein n=1 Tax=Parasphingorhabdus marina TaxID=394732 RepID=UPI000940A0AC|nr:PEPxxWA-CTERM sorting domain-containing protein [Parasphingorhabdus marina]
MSNDVNALVASADRRRRIAIAIFVVAVGIAALFPRNDRAMWVPEETPFVFSAVPEKLPVVYLSIDSADALLQRFVGLGRGGPKGRSRFAPLDPAQIDPILGPAGAARGNIPEAVVPQFGELPTELADAGPVPGGPLNPGAGTPVGGGPVPGGPTTGGPGGGGPGGGPGTIVPVDPDPNDPVDPIPDDPPVLSPVPEPMTWAMFILGFGLIGLAMRSRRRHLVSA